MAVRFDTTGEHYSSSSAPPAAPCTVLCWAMISVDRETYSAIWASDQVGAATYLECSTDIDGATLRVFNSSLVGSGITGPLMVTGTWYRVAFTLDAGGTGTLYWGTAGDILSSASQAGFGAVTSPILTIGEDGTGADWWNGRIANFKHYSAVLTPTEIATELNSWDAVRTANLVRHHKFQTAETTDYSGNGRTLSGGVGASTAADPTIPAAPRASVDLTPVGTSAWVAPATSTSISPTYPSGLAAGDLVLLITHTKPSTATPTTPADWTLIDTVTGGAGTQGAGTGATRMTVFARTVPSGGLTGSQAVTVTGGSSLVAHMRAYRATGANLVYDVGLVSWSVGTASTSIGGSTGSLALAAKDDVVIVAGTTDDQSTSLAVSAVAMSGVTFSALASDPNGTVINAQGNDISAVAYRATVTAGSGSGPATVTAASSSSETAMGIVFRVRGTADVVALSGSGTGTWTFAGTATGRKTPRGSGSGAWSFTGASTGRRPAGGAGTGTAAYAGTATGATARRGTAAGTATWSGLATGITTRGGNAASGWSFSGTATGAMPRHGSAAGAFSFTGTAAGSAVRRGSAAGNWSSSGSAVGASARRGTGSGTWHFLGVALSGNVRVGAGQGALAWTGTAAGTAPEVVTRTGSAAGSWTYVGAAAGLRPASTTRTGAGAGGWSFAGTATGRRRPLGSAVGTWSLVGAAVGSDAEIVLAVGVGTGAWVYVGHAVGAARASLIGTRAGTPIEIRGGALRVTDPQQVRGGPSASNPHQTDGAVRAGVPV